MISSSKGSENQNEYHREERVSCEVWWWRRQGLAWPGEDNASTLPFPSWGLAGGAGIHQRDKGRTVPAAGAVCTGV